MILDNIKDPLNDGIFKEYSGVIYRHFVESLEKQLIEKALDYTRGNQLKAAKILGINRNTMRSKIRKFCIWIK
jgi:two-component system nitrogen regulation response regulator GlnG